MSVPMTDFATPVCWLLYLVGIGASLWFDTVLAFIAVVALAAIVSAVAVFIDGRVEYHGGNR